MKIVLLIRSLERGGAERQAVMLARGLRDAGVDVCVMVFYGGGAFERDLERAGIRQVVLGKAGRWDVVAFLQRLVRELRRENPDVIYGFMGTPNLLTVALRPLFPAVRMIWGVRSSRISHRDYDWLVRLHARMEGALAGFPDLVIVNSAAGARELSRRGFASNKVVIVPNGIDSDAYRRDEGGRERIRREWGLQEDATLVGLVARADPVKAHSLFVRAARSLSERNPRMHFVCVGVGDPVAASSLRGHADELRLTDKMRIEGPRDDVASVYSALDVLVMCSNSEGFPNVVAEAMACGVPCAVTEVGDAVAIVGNTGASTEPGNVTGLAHAVESIVARLQAEGDTLRSATRARIVERYSIQALAKRTLAALEKVDTATAKRRVPSN